MPSILLLMQLWMSCRTALKTTKSSNRRIIRQHHQWHCLCDDGQMTHQCASSAINHNLQIVLMPFAPRLPSNSLNLIFCCDFSSRRSDTTRRRRRSSKQFLAKNRAPNATQSTLGNSRYWAIYFFPLTATGFPRGNFLLHPLDGFPSEWGPTSPWWEDDVAALSAT